MNGKFQLYGKPLKMIRLQNDLKAVEVAKLLGVSKQFISFCETGKRKLSPKKTKEFLDIVGISEEQAKALIQVISK